MELCNLCQGFDIRALLLKSASQLTRPSGITDRNLIDAEDYRPSIPYFYKHQTSIIALKISSAQGCRLCNLIWRTWIKTINKTDFTEEWLEATFEGVIFIGCSGWTASREGLPYVTVIQQSSSGGSRTLCSFEAFSSREGVPPDGFDILGRAVYENPASPECLDVAVEWLQTCRNDHSLCRQTWRPLEDRLPTRVIEVGHESCHPKLIATNGRLGNWVALSYCWGGNSAFVLNKMTEPDLMRGLPLNVFPPTLRDSIIITRRLGIKFLWIDALCIQQDSADDWTAEAAQMREVYAGALLTIAAACSQSTNTGIFAERKVHEDLMHLEWNSPNNLSEILYKVYLRPGSELWDNTLQSSPLMGRGWALQEGLLSPRTLSYGPQQMMWECSTYQTDESGRFTIPTQDYRGKGFIQSMIENRTAKLYTWRKYKEILLKGNVPSPRDMKLKTPTDPYERWYDIVQQFTRRSLTKDTDTLPALAGIAREFQRVMRDVYCAGLWKKDIICGLLWDRLPVWSKDGSTRWDGSKLSQYLAPSWSWAGVRGRQANFPKWRAKNALSSKFAVNVAEVINVRTVLKGSDPFGQVISGKITLEARFHQLVRQPTNTGEDEITEIPQELSGFQQHVHTVFRDTGRIEYEFLQQHVTTPGQKFAIIELVRWAKAPGSGVPGMELMALESTGKENNEYRRIGMFHLRKEVIPDPDAVGTDAYNGIIADNKAWTEVINANWNKKRFIVV